MKKLSTTTFLSIVISTIIFIFLSTFSASAMGIDFRSKRWRPADGFQHYTVAYGGLHVTASAWHKLDTNKRLKLSWWKNDGLGIYGGEPDEIDRYERLTISFSRTIKLKRILLSDLFFSLDGHNDGDPYTGERALLEINGRLYGPYFGEDTGVNNGELYIDFHCLKTNKIIFMAPYGSNNEYSLAWIKFCSKCYPPHKPPTIPEPHTFWLVGIGFLMILASKRKLFKKTP